MDHQQRSLRFGAALIACALVLRLGGSGMFDAAAEFLAKPNIASFLLYLETGRIVRFSQSSETAEVFSMESHTPDFAQKAENLTLLPGFTAEDGAQIPVRYNCSLRPDAARLITAP